MRLLVTFLGLCVVAGFWGVSVQTNFDYGYTIGITEKDHLKYGVIAVLGDLIKSLLPFLFMAALLHKKYIQLVSIGVVFVACVALSLFAGIENGGMSRTAGQKQVETRHNQVREWQQELARIKTALPKQPDPVTAAEYSAMIAAQPFNRGYKRLWKSTRGCTDATAPKSKAFCANLARLELKRQRAARTEKLERQVKTLQDNIARAGLGTIARGQKVQTLITAGLLDISAKKITTTVVVGIALIVEIISSLGFWWFLDHHRTGRATRKQRQRKSLWVKFGSRLKRPPYGSVGAFVGNSAQYASGSKTSCTSAYSTYKRWCTALDYKPVAKTQFKKRFNTHMLRGNAEHAQQKNGEIVWLDLNLKAA